MRVDVPASRRSALALVAEEALDLGGQLVARAQLEPAGRPARRAPVGLLLGGVVQPLELGDHRPVLVVALDELVEALALQHGLAAQRRAASTAMPVAVVRPSSRATDAAGYDIVAT